MSDTKTREPLHEIARKLRDAMDDLLDERIGVTMNTSEHADNTGTVNLTVTSWPKEEYMLNYDRVVAERLAVLDGRSANYSHMPYLSEKANRLAEILQRLLDQFFPPVLDEKTGDPIWPVTGGVIFDSRSLERERIEIIQALKKKQP
jgi:hypothetical protein